MGMLFGGGGSPKPPPPPAPVLMPDLADPALLADRRRKMTAAMGRSGRASTDLTGDDYSGDKLGSR